MRKCLRFTWPISLVAIVLFLSAGCQQELDHEQLLLKQLSHASADERWNATLSIRELKPVPAVYLPPLLKLLDDPDARVRFGAALAIGDAGPAARPHIPALMKLANEHPDVQVRAALQDAVFKINSPQ
jgi:HEAT repeat protein